MGGWPGGVTILSSEVRAVQALAAVIPRLASAVQGGASLAGGNIRRIFYRFPPPFLI